MKISHLLLFLHILLYVSSTSIAVELIASDVPGLLKKNGTGKFQLIMKELATRNSLEFTEVYYPPKRAIKSFLDDPNSCIYIYTDIAIASMGKQNVIASYPLGVFRMYIFTKAGEPPAYELSDVVGKRVGGVIGYKKWYQRVIDGKVEISLKMVASDIQNIKMLVSGRLDAFISFLPDINPYLDQLSYSPEHALMESYDRITCHNNDVGHQFISRVSPLLRKMKKNGSMKQILEKYWLDFEDPLVQDALVPY